MAEASLTSTEMLECLIRTSLNHQACEASERRSVLGVIAHSDLCLDFLSPGQQLRQPGAFHLRVQHPQRPTAVLTNPDSLSASHLLLAACVPHAALCRGGRRRTRQPTGNETGQADQEEPGGHCMWKGERRHRAVIPTAALPLGAVPGLPGRWPQPGPLRSHGDVDLWGGRGLQPGTRQHHQLCAPAFANWLAGPQRTFPEASGADGVSRGGRSSERHGGGRQVLVVGGGDMRRSCWGMTGRRTEATLFSKVLWGPETSGSLVKKKKRCEPKIKRTIISETVVASWHGTLTINKVYFLTRTWG